MAKVSQIAGNVRLLTTVLSLLKAGSLARERRDEKGQLPFLAVMVEL
jgi:hypothetical protein